MIVRKVLLFLLLFVAIESLASTEVCFDPRLVFIQCHEGTSFTGWNKGSCDDGLVSSAICSPCFDPRLVFIKCHEGTKFKRWEKGQCKGGLVAKAICK